MAAVERAARWLCVGLAALLCLGGLAWAFTWADAAARCWPVIGLRYAQPFTEEQVRQAEEYAAKQADAPDALWPTFWKEETGTARADGREAAATAVLVRGDAALAMPARCVRGGLPGAGDEAGCALSRQAAWQLFGADDVVGLAVDWNGRRYTVRGVWAGNDPVLGRGAAPGAGIIQLDLSGSVRGDEREAALNFAAAAGLGTPSQLCYGQSVAAFARVCCYLPLAVAAAWSLAGAWRASRALPPVGRQVLWFAAALAAALCLPWLLGAMPGWLIPARWSDFSFWTTLAQTMRMRLHEWLALRPFYKDVQGKQALLCCAGGILACLACAGWLRRTWTARPSGKRE